MCGQKVHLDSARLSGSHWSPMKMNLPGQPGKGSTKLPCDWKVSAASISVPPTQGWPTKFH